jgi:glycosyl transferase family 4
MNTNTARDERRGPLVAILLDNHHGPDRRIDMEVEMLAEAGIRARVVAWDRRGRSTADVADAAEWRGAPVDLVRLPVPAPAVGGFASIRRLAVFARRVWRDHRRLLAGARVLVANDIYLLPLGWVLSLRTGLPLVYDAHEEFASMEGGRYPEPLLRAVEALESRLARRASLVVVPGETRVPRWERVGIDPLVLRNVGRRLERLDPPAPTVDIAYCGGLSEERRLDVLVELARSRPDLRVAVAGEGRAEGWLAEAAAELPNLEFVGEISTPDEFLARSRAIYYGLDPQRPYAPKACPNTLYQAVRVGRPLVHHGAGEIDRFAARFNVGRRVEPDVASVAGLLDELPALEGTWEFDAAWARMEDDRAAGEYARRMLEIAQTSS